MTAGRRDRITTLYERHAVRVRRQVARRVRAADGVVEDACQTAWLRLCAHDDVSLDDAAAVSWLVITAVREAWRRGRRDASAGSALPNTEHEREFAELPGNAPDPAAVVVRRDETRRALDALTVRERRFVTLQAAGLDYREIAKRLDVSVRTVERQVLRGRRKLREGSRER